MTGPMWVRWMFAALFSAITLYSLRRLLAPLGPGGGDRRVEFVHLTMATGMVLMFSPLVLPVPRLGWELVFGLVSVWCLALLIRSRLAGSERPDSHYLHQVLGCVAMVCMGAASFPGAGERTRPGRWSPRRHCTRRA